MIVNVLKEPTVLSQGELGIPFWRVIIPAPTELATMMRIMGYTQFKLIPQRVSMNGQGFGS